MRALVSMAVAATLAFALGAPRQAEATPEISFGTGVRLPGGCADFGAAGLECNGTGEKTFTLIITVGSDGMQGYSFGAHWDQGAANSLSAVSGQQAFNTTMFASNTPPVHTAQFGPAGGTRSAVPGIIQSTGASEGLVPSWSAVSGVPESPDYVGAKLSGYSYRAGRVTVTIDNTSGTSLQLGFFDPNKDSFLAAGSASITPSFTSGIVLFNGGPVPEPGTTLLMGLGLLGLALASRSSK